MVFSMYIQGIRFAAKINIFKVLDDVQTSFFGLNFAYYIDVNLMTIAWSKYIIKTLKQCLVMFPQTVFNQLLAVKKEILEYFLYAESVFQLFPV